MEQIISKEEFEELMKVRGKTRGVSIKDYGDYILKEKGENGLRRLEEVMTKTGYPIKFKEIKAMAFYPLGLEGLTLLVIKRLFDFDNNEIQEMGKQQAKVSILIRLFMKYFFSLKKTAAVVPRMWRIFYSTGEIDVIELNEEKRYIILRIKDFSLSSIHCQYLRGYLASILLLIVGKETTCEETKCLYQGDEYHEFLLKW